jgi:hypothetical protein
MLLSRDKYLVFFNFFILLCVSLPLLGIEIYNFGYILGYLLISLLFIYYCFGDIFLLTRKKLWKYYQNGFIKLRYKISDDGKFIKHLECCLLDYSESWYELDLSMFGYIDEPMDIKYFNEKLSSIHDINVLFDESDTILSLTRNRRLYESHKYDKIQRNWALSIYYILFSLIYFILIYR